MASHHVSCASLVGGGLAGPCEMWMKKNEPCADQARESDDLESWTIEQLFVPESTMYDE